MELPNGLLLIVLAILKIMNLVLLQGMLSWKIGPALACGNAIVLKVVYFVLPVSRFGLDMCSS